VSVRSIRLIGDPVLRTKALPVTTFDRELRRLVKDLTETMRDAPGSGLAAPQIGVSLRVFTYDVDDEVGHLINPVLGPFSEEMMDGDEGCLSIPDLAFELKRPEHVVAAGQNMYGDLVTIEGSGYLSRALQHETDHLDGILFVDRLDPKTRKEAMKAIREAEWNENGSPSTASPVIKESPHPLFGGRAL
jgi:peptide deformylase